MNSPAETQHPKTAGQAEATVCAIHQPNFFPWLGYFDKMKRADVFIFLDDVINQKTGSTWSNRVQIAIQGQASWVTCPIVRESGTVSLLDVRIDDRKPWRRKFLKTLEMNYKRSPHYEAVLAVLEPLVLWETDRLAEYNIHAITALAPRLGVEGRILRQSELGIEGKSNHLLIALNKAVDAGIYMCGGGADGYQDDALFKANGLQIRHQNYQPAPYGDEKTWIPGLSVIDYLMRCGFQPM